jgi:hypothetical protein
LKRNRAAELVWWDTFTRSNAFAAFINACRIEYQQPENPIKRKTQRTCAFSADGRPRMHPWANARCSCGVKVSFALGRRPQACHVKGRGKLEQRTAPLVVLNVTSVAGSDADMRALCGWRAWKGSPYARGEHTKLKAEGIS